MWTNLQKMFSFSAWQLLTVNFTFCFPAKYSPCFNPYVFGCAVLNMHYARADTQGGVALQVECRFVWHRWLSVEEGVLQTGASGTQHNERAHQEYMGIHRIRGMQGWVLRQHGTFSSRILFRVRQSTGWGSKVTKIGWKYWQSTKYENVLFQVETVRVQDTQLQTSSLFMRIEQLFHLSFVCHSSPR